MFRHEKALAALEPEVDRARLARDWIALQSLLKKISKTVPDSTLEALIKAEQLLYGSSNPDVEGVKALLEGVLAKNASDPDALYLLAEIYFPTSKERALSYLNRLARPVEAELPSLSVREARVLFLAYEMRGACQHAAQRPEDASASYAIGFELLQKAKVMTVDDATRTAVDRLLAAYLPLRLAQGDYLGALEAFRTVLRFAPLSVDQRGKWSRAFAHFLIFTCPGADWRRPSRKEDLQVPGDQMEEALLLLQLLEESQRSLPFAKQAEGAAQAANLYALACMRRHQPALAAEAYEKALAFPGPEPYLWRQLACALAAAGKHARALVALEEYLHFHKHDQAALLLAAKLSLNHLRNPVAAAQYAELCADVPGSLAPRAKLAQGLAALASALQPTLATRAALQRFQQALELFEAARVLDPSAAAPTYGLALVHAHLRELDQARSYALLTLSRDRLHRPSLLLSALLVTASKDLEKAMALCMAALLHYPSDLQLLLLRAKLELAGGNTTGALATYQRCVGALRELRPPEIADPARADGEPVAVVPRPQAAAPVAGSRGRAEAAPTALNLGPRPVNLCPRPPQATLSPATRLALDDPTGLYQLELELWRAAGAAFVAAGQVDEAQGCVQELRAMSPAGPAASHLEGLIAEQLHQPGAECYEKALTFDPAHVPSLLRLGLWHASSGRADRAEHCFKYALKTEHLNHEAWAHLGALYLSLDRAEEASDCLLKAAELEHTAPLLPFSICPVLL